jgi:hypothetical protein
MSIGNRKSVLATMVLGTPWSFHECGDMRGAVRS